MTKYQKMKQCDGPIQSALGLMVSEWSDNCLQLPSKGSLPNDIHSPNWSYQKHFLDVYGRAAFTVTD